MKQTNQATSKLNVQIKIALLGTIAFLLMFLEFPILPAAPFLKIDFSDLPALLGTFALGPIAGIAVELIKNILVVLIKGTSTAGIGEFANFVIGAVWVIVAGFIYKRNRTIKGAILGLSLGTIALTIAGLLGNYYIFLPLYNKIVPVLSPEIINYLVTIILPFNLIKGVGVSVVTLVLYKKVSPILYNETTINAKKITN
ncbi:ECF transporter S component [Clostridium folliculivorans]|uniref:Riboflavin transporter n=1 Tax=Clostridium folliculivorans TaxID=2886038 RepID=A0A9W5XYI7_9CLOT|nr:ECF transporter S component [Clostridium folliculivorans]GKU23338.1 riboflavin transporter [Clostridium folliculivorans]GKU29455.1 riboflavin transporter [Clostridium folliculivorans]